MRENERTRSSLPGSFLSEANRDTVTAFLQKGTKRVFGANEVLFHQGEPSNHVVILQSGWVKIVAISDRGWESLLALRGAGDIVGEMSAIDGRSRGATVRTLTSIEATVLPGPSFIEMVTTVPTHGLTLLKHIASKLRESDSRRSEFGSTNGHERLVRLLVKLMKQYGKKSGKSIVIDVPLSQRELAAAVGVSRQIASKTLRVLRERSIVETSRQKILVKHPEALEALAESV